MREGGSVVDAEASDERDRVAVEIADGGQLHTLPTSGPRQGRRGARMAVCYATPRDLTSSLDNEKPSAYRETLARSLGS
jgi:hypothetical protein